MTTLTEKPIAAREVIQRASKSFSLAARLLDPRSRQQVERLYAWCRLADDSVDLAQNKESAQMALTEWSWRIDALYNPFPRSDSAVALVLPVVQERCIPRLYFDEFLAGLEMDVNGIFAPSEHDFLLYCHRVAGVVGLMLCHVLGVDDDQALPHAAALGMGMQMVNIARDVAEDWQRGRLYLPATWLARVPSRQELLSDDELSAALKHLLELAKQHLAAGRAGLRFLNGRSRLAVRVAADVYFAIGSVIASRGYRVSAGRAVVSTTRKVQLLFAAGIRSLIEPFVQARGRKGSVLSVTHRPPQSIWHFDPDSHNHWMRRYSHEQLA